MDINHTRGRKISMTAGWTPLIGGMSSVGCNVSLDIHWETSVSKNWSNVRWFGKLIVWAKIKYVRKKDDAINTPGRFDCIKWINLNDLMK